MSYGGTDRIDIDLGPLAGETIYVLGRVHGLTRARLHRLFSQAGGRIAPRASLKVSLVVIAHSARESIRPDGGILLPAGLPPSAVLISEDRLRQTLGLLPPPEPVEQGLGAAELQRIAGVSSSTLTCLSLFDVVQPQGDQYGYRDLVAAREVSRLLQSGVDLPTIIAAALQLRRGGEHLSEMRLVGSPSGRLARDVAGSLAELSGQLTMSLAFGPAGIDDLFAAAEAAEAHGDYARAESLYATAARADRGDPVVPFNLGNVFGAQGRTAEAKVAWQMAVARDPGFAEAWYNLALTSANEGNPDLAAALYRRAAQARPEYGDAHFNLALILTQARRYAEALPVWETFLGLEASADQRAAARRAATLCRMEVAGQGRDGASARSVKQKLG